MNEETGTIIEPPESQPINTTHRTKNRLSHVYTPLDTITTIDDLLAELRSGTINFDDPAKQALLKWHLDKARSYVLEVIGDEKSFERMYDGKTMEFFKDGKQYYAVPLYTAVQTLKEYRRTIDQTLKAIGGQDGNNKE